MAVGGVEKLKSSTSISNLQGWGIFDTKSRFSPEHLISYQDRHTTHTQGT